MTRNFDAIGRKKIKEKKNMEVKRRKKRIIFK